MNLTLDDLPTGIMGIAGLLLLLLALKGADKAAIKMLNALIAIALLTAAIWWHIHRH